MYGVGCRSSLRRGSCVRVCAPLSRRRATRRRRAPQREPARHPRWSRPGHPPPADACTRRGWADDCQRARQAAAPQAHATHQIMRSASSTCATSPDRCTFLFTSSPAPCSISTAAPLCVRIWRTTLPRSPIILPTSGLLSESVFFIFGMLRGGVRRCSLRLVGCQTPLLPYLSSPRKGLAAGTLQLCSRAGEREFGRRLA